jgi:16S rRNA (uracil1498-N3)-methyltransferase
MRQPRIYDDQPLILGQTLSLAPQAASHVARVLRLTQGATVTLFNSDGHEYESVIVSATKKSVEVLVTAANRVDRESPLTSHIGLVISKGDRFEYALQKATELGVSHITPLTSSRCEVHLKGDRLQKKLDQWQAICVSACEQSQRNVVPTVAPVSAIADWIGTPFDGLSLVLHHRAAQPLSGFERPEAVRFLIGPEGGLSEAEIEAALTAGFNACLFGPRVLRTETAPLVALSVAQALWGDF